MRLNASIIRDKSVSQINEMALIVYSMTRYIADHSGTDNRVEGSDTYIPLTTRENIIYFKRMFRGNVITLSQANRDYKAFRNICNRELKHIDTTLKLGCFQKQRIPMGVYIRVRNCILGKRSSPTKQKRGGYHPRKAVHTEA